VATRSGLDLAHALEQPFKAAIAARRRRSRSRSTHATIWVANRGVHTIRGFDARTGEVVHTVAMAPNSQPGDLAFAKGKLYVAEEFGTPPSIAIVDPEPGGSL
jgi:hypothetical protein